MLQTYFWFTQCSSNVSCNYRTRVCVCVCLSLVRKYKKYLASPRRTLSIVFSEPPVILPPTCSPNFYGKSGMHSGIPIGEITPLIFMYMASNGLL